MRIRRIPVDTLCRLYISCRHVDGCCAQASRGGQVATVGTGDELEVIGLNGVFRSCVRRRKLRVVGRECSLVGVVLGDAAGLVECCKFGVVNLQLCGLLSSRGCLVGKVGGHDRSTCGLPQVVLRH